MAVVLTLGPKKQIRINIYKRNNSKNTAQKIQNTVNTSIRGLLEKYPTFGPEKETGLLGALDT